MPEIPFPTSTAPGVDVGGSGGRLINAYAEPAPDGSRSKVVWRRAPGLAEEFTVGDDVHRGSVLVGDVLYVANGDSVYTVSGAPGAYTVTSLTGTLSGSGPVFMERNMRATPQILIVHSDGMSQIASGAVSDFSDADLPSVNSITFTDGYFIVTSLAGKAYASGINDITFSSLDFATAESSPDYLIRAVAFGRDLMFMGGSTIEFWNNTGNKTGFPFSRGPVIPVGLKGRYAVAGQERGFPAPLVWVANDNTVRRLDSYSPTRISSPALERLIEAVANADDLEASVYVENGHACWVLSGPAWTWIYDLATGFWHERKSYEADRWRAHYGVNAFNRWLTFDRASNKVFSLSGGTKTEDGDPLIWEVRSTQASGFPGRLTVNQAAFDFETGVGLDRGISPIQTEPKVSIAWSNDGGRTFGNDLLRDLGTQGQQQLIRIFRGGLTGPRGRQYRLRISDPVDIAFYGAQMDIEQRAS